MVVHDLICVGVCLKCSVYSERVRSGSVLGGAMKDPKLLFLFYTLTISFINITN